jgi:DNA-binding SARP family transcriptional activator
MWSGTISLLGAHMHAVNDASRSADPSVSEPHANAALPIQVCLFGGLTLLKRGTPLTWRGGARTEALLLSIVLQEKGGVSRERLLAQVWPETEASLAVQSLHSLVHSLHRMLSDVINGAMPVVHAGEIYRLNLEAGIAVDITAFDALARRGNQAWHAGLRAAACESYLDAVDLYRGDLHACTDDSAVVERERLRASYLVMLGRLADTARRDNDYSSALEYASLVLKYDAGREDAHRTLMSCYARLGQRVQAMRQYLICERLLRETFDAVPEPATRTLYDRLKLEPGAVLEED